ncbi:branched-chain amino acid ABC transporter substrate-binding protein [Lapillicoccus jejuensis]|uniref:Amino acid/amide ABC transporter substrate-binding protein (HAAT family) n=1 Tax=Lapillicoccus jejuensis TaxID=402171 RepID=A0A542E466_9MICO|nr:branched-chain amino acid ABC transporter substrate-binding protein [Lapillicoccus jejuensis]TQJ10105.1 amino acid/amide ABC transporter substrate-binding protein (HAAT family) [Lapillicoccus jejuensis]
MQQRSIVRLGVPLAVAALALSACGSRGGDNGSSGGSSGGGGSTKTVKIGVIAPLSGDLSALGKGIQHSVELAVKEANANNTVPGWKLEVEPVDDEAKADVGKNAATKLAADDQVVGVVGDLNSSVSQQTQPIFAAANITQISPANTNPSLTIGADSASPKRTYKTYFRTCTTDAVQGPFAAQYLLAQGIKQVATINDKKTYGQGLVNAFTTEFKKGGGTITGAFTINPDESNYQTVVSQAAATSPKAVYYGGEYPQAGPLSQQMKAAGLNVPLMGGDGIYDPQYIKLAGAKSDGDLATSVGAPTESTDAGKKFLASYQAAGYAEPAAAYGGYSYDAANAIIAALKTSLSGASDVKSARQATVDAVGKVSFDGVTGKVAFDEYGDTTSKILTVYKVTSGAWAADKTDEFK